MIQNSQPTSCDGKCILCNKNAIISDVHRGEFFCGGCGCVFSERDDVIELEWKYENNDNEKRTGSPVSLAMHDKGLSTVIGSTNRDAFGKPLSGSMRDVTERLRRWDNRSHINESAERNFREAFSYLNNLKCKLDLSDAIVESTAYIYRKATYRGLVRGRSIPNVLAASLYAACRHAGTPRTISDISIAINLSKKIVAKTYRLLLRELDLKMPVLDPINCVARIASNTGMSEKTKRQAFHFLQTAVEKEETIGKDPMGMAAAALYLSCIINDEKPNQKRIAKAANVCEITIRTRCRGLIKILNFDA